MRNNRIEIFISIVISEIGLLKIFHELTNQMHVVFFSKHSIPFSLALPTFETDKTKLDYEFRREGKRKFENLVNISKHFNSIFRSIIK